MLPPPLMLTIKNQTDSHAGPHLATTTGPRAVPGSQRPGSRKDGQMFPWPPMHSDTLRAEDGSRSGHSRNSCLASLALVLFGVLIFTGCTPEGPRALLAGKRLIDQGKYSQAVEKLRTATALLVTNAQ